MTNAGQLQKNSTNTRFKFSIPDFLRILRPKKLTSPHTGFVLSNPGTAKLKAVFLEKRISPVECPFEMPPSGVLYPLHGLQRT
ncbi:MAG: hypothetical protein IPH12_16175 [Saprospirales bacterium]|jgi:hypothetical protein|nr:hypothetical protein [Saprospirales bacterium]